MTVLRPDGWHVHQVGNETSITACISKESIQIEGSFKTGLTLNAIQGIKHGLRQHNPNYDPDTPVLGTLEMLYPGIVFGTRQPTHTGYNFLSDPRIEILHFDQGVQRTPGSRLFRFQYRQHGPMRPDMPWHGPIICQNFMVEFDESDDVYHFTFESPESSWQDGWRIGKQILTNLVFSANGSTSLIFSVDPALPADGVLQTKAIEAGLGMGWSLAYENRSEGLFIWRTELPAPAACFAPSPARDSQPTIRCCFSWYMKRVGNELWVDDPLQFEPLHFASEEAMEQLNDVARNLQEDFKKRWLALVGPVTMQGAHPETHSTELQIGAMVDLLQEGKQK
jgi:hypothetical protein